MTWKLNGDLIMDGEKLVGSIAEDRGAFHVEIMWSARGGDLKHTAASRAEALAFVKGAEQMLDRWCSADTML